MVRAPVKLALLSTVLAIVPIVGFGCRPAGGPPASGVVVTPPESWRSMPPATWMVPGTPLAAWSGPEGSSLVLYRTLPVPDGTATMLAEAVANRLESQPETRLLVKRAETTASATAARVEAVGPGTGDALAPSGLGVPVAPPGKSLVPTRQVNLVFARPTETICLTWHLPERAHDLIAPDIEATVKTVQLTSGGPARAQGY